MTRLRAAALAGLLACWGAPVQAADYCGGVWHQNSCGRPTNIYPCCDNGANCTWWAWEMMCRNWGIGPNNWGNANTWGGNARLDPRFEVVGPVSGAVATSTQGGYGHVAWTIAAGGGSVTVTDQNCCSTCAGRVLTRSFGAGFFNSGYVIPRGSLCACSPGQQERRSCGDCGTSQRVCGSSCQWGGWSACAGPDPEGGNQVCVNGQVGVCADARRRCEGGTLACRRLIEPSAERCDGLDNDCDGELDEGNPVEGASQRDYAATRIDSSFPRAAPAGSKATLWVEFTNSGRKTWERGAVWLAARGDGAGVSAFASDSWPAYDLPAGLANPVAPGEVGRFTFEITLPDTPGARLSETFQLEGPGRAAMRCPDGELSVSLLVLNADGSAPAALQAQGGEPPKGRVNVQGLGCTSTGRGPTALLLLAALWLLRARRARLAGGAALAVSGCLGDAQLVAANRPMTIYGVAPASVSARGGEVLTLTGSGFVEESLELLLGGRRLQAQFISDAELRVRTPPLFAGREPLVLAPGSRWRTELLGGLEVVPLALRFVEAPPHALAPRAGSVDSSGLADLDADGDLDLLTCGTRCEVLLNDGRGNFLPPSADAGVTADGGAAASADAGQPPRPLPAGRLLALGDLDGDASPDAVLLSGGGGRVHLNAGGRLAGEASLELPGLQALTAGDLDGDGRVELVVAAAGGLAVRPLASMLRVVSEADGGAGQLPIPAARALTLADLDGDGDDDLILSTQTAPGGVSLLLFLNAAGVLTEVPGGLPGSPVQVAAGLAAGDVDLDGDVDLVVACSGQDRLLLNDGSAHFFDATLALFPVDNSEGVSVALVDLDRDRAPDLLVGNRGAAARMYVNDGRGRFADKTPLLPVVTRTLAGAHPGDLDGDGDDDLLLVGASPADSRLYLSVEPRP
ncbi:MAG: hypothetical protein AMXMBFR34_24400 [Myxococcaceae bacterium]